jgi:3-hydroxyisobutyrate dehydrogenase
MKYGYVGLGHLGGHLAMSLIKAGFDVTVFDLDATLAQRHVAAGAKRATSIGELVSKVDHIFTCLPSPVVSEKVLDQILPHAREGMTWIENSTLGRDEILRLAAKAEAAGLKMLEAPVTGGVHLAARGEVTVLIGGEEALFITHKAALEKIGNRIFLMGPLGSAAVIKVITNMLAFIHLVADAEALMLAKRGGLDLAQSWRAIAASSGNSFVHETEGQLILNGSYDIAFTMDLALKDLGFAMKFGQDFSVPLELAEKTYETFKKGKTAYGGQAQSTQIAKLLEDALSTDLRAEGFPSRLT